MVVRLKYYHLYLRIAAFALPVLAFAVAAYLRFVSPWGTAPAANVQWHQYVGLMVMTTIVWIAMAERHGVTSVEELFRERTGLRRAVAAWTSTYVIDLTVLFFTKNNEAFSRIFFVLSAVALLLFTLVMRALFRAVVRRNVSGRRPIPVVLVGTDRFARHAAMRLRRNPFVPCEVVGYVQVPGQEIVVNDALIVGAESVDALAAMPFEDIVFAVAPKFLGEVPGLLRDLERFCKPMRAILDFGEGVVIRDKLFQFGRMQMLALGTTPTDSLKYRIIKRAFDIVFASCALLVTAPLMIAVAVAIKLTSPGPILFVQERVGLNGRVFNMYKFRTMRVAPRTESDTAWTIEEDPRRTALGALLRKTSLDELPQFFNVLKGDMSVVGPRPERPFYVNKFLQDVSKYNNRHALKVGITGWAQVNGWRGDTSIRKRVDYDLYYLQNWSLAFDLRIIFLTAWSALNRNAY